MVSIMIVPNYFCNTSDSEMPKVSFSHHAVVQALVLHAGDPEFVPSGDANSSNTIYVFITALSYFQCHVVF